MTTAGGLALMILGAILKYAVTWQPEGINLDILGTILIYGGAAGVVLGLLLTWTRRRRDGPPPGGYGPDDRYYEDPPRW